MRPLYSVVAPLAVVAATFATFDAAAESSLQPVWPAELPALEELDNNSDFTPFMAPDVPVEIRRQALRRLWRIVGWESDRLGTYEDDYTTYSPLTDATVAKSADSLDLVAR